MNCLKYLFTKIRDKETTRIDFVKYSDRLMSLISEEGFSYSNAFNSERNNNNLKNEKSDQNHDSNNMKNVPDTENVPDMENIPGGITVITPTGAPYNGKLF